jgi:hybrid cluster-associated redox disulfide protein
MESYHSAPLLHERKAFRARRRKQEGMAQERARIDPDSTIDEVVAAYPIAREVLVAFGLRCGGCSVSTKETIAQGVASHGLELAPVLRALESALRDGHVPPIAESERTPLRRPPPKAQGALASIGAVVPVMSGKGGVGKSFTTALLAVGLRRRNLRVGIIDADITGPSIPRFFGLRESLAIQPDPTQYGLARPRGLFVPARTRSAIEVVSSNLLIEEEDKAMIWRGPIVSGVIKQFYEQTLWSDLDVLLIDLPPGTSDAPLTVLQSLPVAGVVLVTMPQRLATMIVRKAAGLINQLERRVLGVVENMAYYTAPDTGKRYNVFGPSYADDVVARAQAPLIARLPIDPLWMDAADHGDIESIGDERCDELAAAFIESLEALSKARAA